MIQKISIASQVSNPIPEDVMIKVEIRKILIISLFLFLSDMIICNIINICLIHYVIVSNKKKTYYFEIYFVLIYIFIIYILLLVRKTIFALVSIILYGIFGLVYFIYKFINLLNEITTDQKENFKEEFYEEKDLIFFSLNLITFIIRIITEIYLKNYIDNLSKIDELNRLFEHEKFIEDLGNKIDNGNRWTSNFINDNDSDEVVLKFNN
jgi:hypothetical protein